MKQFLVLVLLIASGLSQSAFACGYFPSPVFLPPAYADPGYRVPDDVTFGPMTKLSLILTDYAPKEVVTNTDGLYHGKPMQEFDADIARYNGKVESFLRSRSAAAVSPLKRETVTNYGCQDTFIDTNLSFLDALNRDTTQKSGLAEIITARQAVPHSCQTEASPPSKDLITAALKASNNSLFARYLEAANAFYEKDYPTALALFKKLEADAPKPHFWDKYIGRTADTWLSQTAIYMTARTELVSSQNKWDGYAELTGAIDQNLLDDSARDFKRYLSLYPNGLYQSSAEGITRKVLFLKGDNAALGRILRLNLDHAFTPVPTTRDKQDAALAVLDEDNIHDKAEPDAQHDPFIILLYQLMRSDPPITTADVEASAPSEDQKDTTEVWGKALPIIQSRKDDIAKDPALFRLLQAYVLFRLERYADLINLTPEEPVTAKVVSLTTEVLRARSFGQMKDKANELKSWQHVATASKDDQSQLQVASLYINANDLKGLVGPESALTNANIIADFATFGMTNNQIKELLSAAPMSDSVRFALEQSLFQKFILQDDFSGMKDLYAVAPNAGKYGSLKQAVETLSSNPKDAEGLITIGTFKTEHYISAFSSSYKDRADDEESAVDELAVTCDICKTYKDRSKNSDPAIKNFAAAEDLLKSANKKSDAEAKLLHTMVMCFKGGTGPCLGGNVDLDNTPNLSKDWFARLHKLYPNSDAAEQTPYYY